MKDALGHGSNSHEIIDTHNSNKVMSQHPTFRKAFNATKKLEPTKEGQMPLDGWQYQIRPIQSGASQNTAAAAQLSSGPKSAPVPVHDSMVAFNVNPKTGPTPEQKSYASQAMYGSNRDNAWGQSPKDAKIARKQIRDAKRQNRMR